MYYKAFKHKIHSFSDAKATYLETGLADFKEAIDNKSEYTEVQEILLGPIQTNLQSAFNLQVIPEFPLPLLMVIPALAGIIFADRFKAFRAS